MRICLRSESCILMLDDDGVQPKHVAFVDEFNKILLCFDSNTSDNIKMALSR